MGHTVYCTFVYLFSYADGLVSRVTDQDYGSKTRRWIKPKLPSCKNWNYLSGLRSRLLVPRNEIGCNYGRSLHWCPRNLFWVQLSDSFQHLLSSCDHGASSVSFKVTVGTSITNQQATFPIDASIGMIMASRGHVIVAVSCSRCRVKVCALLLSLAPSWLWCVKCAGISFTPEVIRHCCRRHDTIDRPFSHFLAGSPADTLANQ